MRLNKLTLGDCRFSLFLVALLMGATLSAQSPAGFLFSAAYAQSKPEEDLQKFKKDVQKFGKEVREKFQSLMEKLRHGDLPEGFAKTNGRIEATEIDISPKYAGRLANVFVDEGDEVKAGQVLAVIQSGRQEFAGLSWGKGCSGQSRQGVCAE
jgi:multidrug efflux pump subunit AcrA (membrane-fusion protein)